MNIARNFRKKQIPIDCIVLDADYLQDYEPFRINTQRFPDMKGMADSLSKMNIELTASVNPGIKIDSSYSAHWDGLKKDIFLKYSDGSLYEALMDPSMNHWVDFTSAKGRAWWTDNMRFLPENGIHGYWNDMNEPAVTGQSLPENLVFDFDGRKTFTAQAKNVYGMQMARASYEAGIKFGEGRRPFILTRSAFAGIQRYSAIWSGDNQAKDDFILSGVLLNCQMGLSGIPFTGPDLGGYIGDGNKELYKRWVEVGMFSPFVRNHREAYAQASEPWAYGEEAECISKSYIDFRYRLLPYIYSTFHEASKNGIPIARSLCLYYPLEPMVFDNSYQYQFMFGDAFLIVPLTSQDKAKKIYFPPGQWYDFFTDKKISGGQDPFMEFPMYQLPIYVKSSSIIPMQKSVQSTKDNAGDTLFVHIYNGDNSNAFDWYEDDGATMNYLKQDYCLRKIEFDPQKKQIRFESQEGKFKTSFHFVKFILHGFSESNPNFRLGEKSLAMNRTRIPVLDPLDLLASIYDPNYLQSLKAQRIAGEQVMITVPYVENGFVVSW
jgi:alpha-glucosidase